MSVPVPNKKLDVHLPMHDDGVGEAAADERFAEGKKGLEDARIVDDVDRAEEEREGAGEEVAQTLQFSQAKRSDQKRVMFCHTMY